MKFMFEKLFYLIFSFLLAEKHHWLYGKMVFFSIF